MRTELPKRPRKSIAPHILHCSNENIKNIAHSLIERANETSAKDRNIDASTKYRILEKRLTNVKNENTKKNKYRLSAETIQLIEERRNLLSKHSKKENFKLITKLSKKIRENIRKDRKTRRLQTLEKHIKSTGGVKKAFKETDNVWIPKLNKKKNTMSNRKDINKIATTFYQDLY